ncbi:MAG: hypothetical protein FWD39_06080, partial [Clostridiales bacterium]|nr:hypothetical protein [Clostridiales bacterium]
LWAEVMKDALQGIPIKQFSDPGGWHSVQIDAKSGLLPSPLTPAAYIKSEKFPAGKAPTAISNAWYKPDICAGSGKIANPYCTQIDNSKVYLRPLDGETPYAKTYDYALYAPQELCGQHNKPPTDMVTVTLCTDPRHHGQSVLANIPKPGQTGGCPKEFLLTKLVAGSAVPQNHCGLTNHAVAGGEPAFKLEVPASFDVEVTTGSGGAYAKISWLDLRNDPGKTVYVIERVMNGDMATRVEFTAYGNNHYDYSLIPGNLYQYRIYAYSPSQYERSGWSAAVIVFP